jgi:VanZ family protein
VKRVNLSGRRAAFRIFWAAGVLIVIAGSMLPSDSMPVQAISRLPMSDKALHFCAYAVLAFLPVLYERLRTALVVAVCLAAIGVLVEIGQSYTASRFFETKDIAANGIGVLFGLMAGLPYRA